VTIDPPVVVLGALALVAFFVRGLTGAASAIVFNAAFVVLVAAGLAGGLGLLDGLYWIALADLAATAVLLVALRTQLTLEPFVRNFLIGSVPVNVLATIALPRLDLTLLTGGLGLAVLLAGAYLALMPRVRELSEPTLRRWAIPVGMAAGVLGGLYGMSGPVAVLFVSHAGGDPSRFRARVTVMALAWGSVRVTVLALGGAYTGARLEWSLLTLPAVFLGLAAGYWAHRFVQPRPFRVLLGVVVALAGAVALSQTFA
jgi:uncharacterized protein